MQTIFDLVASVPPSVWHTAIVIVSVMASAFVLWQAKKGIAALSRTAKKSNTKGEDLLTWVAAAIATGVSAQGMWRFAGDVLGFDGPLKVMLFAFIEVAMFTSAVRARRNMRENFSAGIDGMAVWVLTCLSAVLSCMDARSLPEAIFRLAAPLVAAWLWERGMAIERHRATGRKRINWRLTPERVMVWFGLAETSDRTASEVDARRRFDRVALAAKRVRALREAGAKKWRIARAKAKLERLYAAAHAHTGIGRDEALQQALAKEIASLYSAGSLVDLEPASAWTEKPAQPSDFARLADETQRLNEGLAARHDRDSLANLAMLAAMATGNHLVPVTPGVTVPVTHAEVTSEVTKEVTDPPFFPPREWLDEAAGVTPGVTDSVTVERVTDQVTEKVTFDVTNRALFDLRWPPLEISTVTDSVTSDEVTDEVTSEVTATQRMREHWDANVANDIYPSVTELAEVGGLKSHSHPSRLREKWVAELSWHQRRKANPKKAINGSKQSS